LPIAAACAYVKSILNGLAMPGGLDPMVAYIMPPDPNVEAQFATAYVWPTEGDESRNPETGGAIPRNTGPNTPAGTKSQVHSIDVFCVYMQADDDPQADSLFPGVIDAVMDALRTSEDPARIIDPYTGGDSQLIDLGEKMKYHIVVSALDDQRYNRLDGLIVCPVNEIFHA
jgi:hypothetical protein